MIVSKKDIIQRDIYFQVKSFFQNRKIRTTKDYWSRIVNVKHPSIQKHEPRVKLTLKLPEQIRQSKKDKKVFLYYRKFNKYYYCVVVKHLNGRGYILTSYITSAIQEGIKIWPR